MEKKAALYAITAFVISVITRLIHVPGWDTDLSYLGKQTGNNFLYYIGEDIARCLLVYALLQLLKEGTSAFILIQGIFLFSLGKIVDEFNAPFRVEDNPDKIYYIFTAVELAWVVFVFYHTINRLLNLQINNNNG